jgi:hypothetical protein
VLVLQQRLEHVKGNSYRKMVHEATERIVRELDRLLHEATLKEYLTATALSLRSCVDEYPGLYLVFSVSVT